VLLGELGFHARDGCADEERNKELICAFCSDLLESRDIGSTIFELDDEQRMVGTKENEI